MLAQLQRLPLIIAADVAPVQNVRHLGHALVDEAADDLAVVENERPRDDYLKCLDSFNPWPW